MYGDELEELQHQVDTVEVSVEAEAEVEIEVEIEADLQAFEGKFDDGKSFDELSMNELT